MYNYEEQKASVFTEKGQAKFLKIRDRVHKLLNEAGAVRMDAAINGALGDSWESLACVDRLVELGEIVEVPQATCAGQHRIFTQYNYNGH